jgi:hypothetical protein
MVRKKRPSIVVIYRAAIARFPLLDHRKDVVRSIALSHVAYLSCLGKKEAAAAHTFHKPPAGPMCGGILEQPKRDLVLPAL